MAQPTKFSEVGDRVWVARYESYDVNVTAVGGEAGLLVVDTHASASAAREVVADLRRLCRRPVVGVVNTHAHHDHWFGNGVLLAEYGPVPVTAHEAAATTMRAMATTSEPVEAAAPGGTALVAADRTFSSVRTIDLGDRSVELVHPGRGHTDGDLVVRLGDADVLLAGDLVEESGAPAYGDDCFPMDWPLALDLVISLLGPGTVVVPGHGVPVERDFVQEQRSAIGVVAETVRDLASRGVRVEEALGTTQWPYPAEVLGHAVRRGYEQLPRSQKRLPLL